MHLDPQHVPSSHRGELPTAGVGAGKGEARTLVDSREPCEQTAVGSLGGGQSTGTSVADTGPTV